MRLLQFQEGHGNAQTGRSVGIRLILPLPQLLRTISFSFSFYSAYCFLIHESKLAALTSQSEVCRQQRPRLQHRFSQYQLTPATQLMLMLQPMLPFHSPSTPTRA
jgi:hypothetical protein